MNFNEVQFEFAAGTKEQLPKSDMPEIVFQDIQMSENPRLSTNLCREKRSQESAPNPVKQRP